MTIINAALDAVMDEIDALQLFANITRGALGTKDGLCCEIGPSSPSEIYLNKDQYLDVDVTLNGKHASLETVSEAMNAIHEALTTRTDYPTGTGWKIVDIQTTTAPQIVEREANNTWLMASSLSVRVFAAAATE